MMRTTTVTTIFGLLLFGCGDSGGDATASASNGSSETSDSDSDSDSDSNSVSVSDSDSNSMSASMTDSDTDPTTETSLTTSDPDSSSTDPTDASSSGGDECTEKDACIEDGDCMPGQTCLGCICLGEPTGCATWGEGVYGDCLAEGNDVCMADGAGCLTAAEDIGVCFFSGCETPCDCPQPPKGFEEQVTCESISQGDEELDCFIACGPEECPEGMFCVQGTLCMFGDAPAELPPYSDCVNVEGQCSDAGICIVDDPMNVAWGSCSPGCTEDADCPAPDSGAAAPACIDVSGMEDFVCLLFCDPETACPDGMVCEVVNAQVSLCAWEVVEEDIGEPYGDCETLPIEDACLMTDTCVATPQGSVCAGACDVVDDCAAAPATGDAVLTCGDLGDGNVCFLSCALGEMCPDGMVCSMDDYCYFE